MAKIVYRKIKKAFKVEYGSSGNFIDFQEGKYMLTIPKMRYKDELHDIL